MCSWLYAGMCVSPFVAVCIAEAKYPHGPLKVDFYSNIMFFKLDENMLK